MVRKDGRTAPRFRPQRHRRAIRAGSHKTPHRLHAVVADEPTMSLGVTRSLSGVLVLGSFAQGSFSTWAAGSQGRTSNRCIWRARRHFGYHQLLEPAPGAANGDKSSGCGVFKRGRSEKGQIKYLNIKSHSIAKVPINTLIKVVNPPAAYFEEFSYKSLRQVQTQPASDGPASLKYSRLRGGGLSVCCD